MTTTYSKHLLSESTNGKGIKIAQTSTAGTLLHTAVAGTSDLDEIHIRVINTQAASVKLTIEWGEATAPDGNIEVIIPGESGLFKVVDGLLLQNGLEVRAFAAVANVLIVHGFVNRITA